MEYGIALENECYYCKGTGLTAEDKFCPNCGFPHSGSEYEMNEFIRKANGRLTMIDEQKNNIKKARNILFGLAALFTVFGIVLGLLIQKDFILLLTNIIVGVIYLGLALWFKKNPFASILTGFILYLTLQVINGIFEPSTIYQGVILKFIIISGLYYGYNAVKKAQNLENELKSIEFGKDLSKNNDLQ